LVTARSLGKAALLGNNAGNGKVEVGQGERSDRLATLVDGALGVSIARRLPIDF
jgi:hypothetical protein